jgi:hypothetical protein
LMGLDVSSGTQLYRCSRPHTGLISFPRLRFIAVTITHEIQLRDWKLSRYEI